MQNDKVIASNRFGLGARPGELENVGPDVRHWLLNQLQGPSRSPGWLADLPPAHDILVEFQGIQEMKRDAKRAAEEQPSPDVVKKFGSAIRRHYIAQTDARFKVSTSTDYPFHERLVHFWGNHFAVSADKPPITALAGVFEKEAIRPNLDGSFYDLLLAAEKHPAMIFYLDNQRSVGPNSELGSRASRRRSDRPEVGLNENLAREILELHTLGVDGGYTQEDVTTFAKVITGWSIGGAGQRGRFAEGKPGHYEFRDNIHEPGSKIVLGKRYSQEGERQGEAVLKDLAHNRATAEHISRKLATHFVADDPPKAMVDRLSAIYLDTGGDLPSLHRALVESAEPWQQVFGKYKTPKDFLISTFRALDRTPDDGRHVIGALDSMGQAPFRPGSPAGWPDTADHWGGADALYKRIEWANTVARVAGSQVDPLLLGNKILGEALGDHSRTAISRAESRQQGLTMLLVSPEFQQR